MTTPDLVALAGLVALAVCFYLTRRSLPRFAAVGAVVVTACCAVLLGRADGRTAEGLLCGAGVALCWFGLLGTMTMLQRSVSLQLLAELVRGESEACVKINVAARLVDGQTFRVIRRDPEGYGLTGFGRFVAAMVKRLYEITGEET